MNKIAFVKAQTRNMIRKEPAQVNFGFKIGGLVATSALSSSTLHGTVDARSRCRACNNKFCISQDGCGRLFLPHRHVENFAAEQLQ